MANTITTHDAVTAGLTQEWTDPAEQHRQDQRAREHLRLHHLREQVAEMQREISELEVRLATPLYGQRI